MEVARGKTVTWGLSEFPPGDAIVHNLKLGKIGKQKGPAPLAENRAFNNGRGDRIRTYDFQLPKLTLYQTELRPATA